MPSGWSVYYILFLSAFFALGIPAFLAFVSHWTLPKREKKAAPISRSALEEGLLQSPGALRPGDAQRMPEDRRINTRFFLAVNVSLILITLMLSLIPCVGLFHDGHSREDIFRGLISILTISIFSSLGLLYAARKGDLSWLKAYLGSKEGS